MTFFRRSGRAPLIAAAAVGLGLLAAGMRQERRARDRHGGGDGARRPSRRAEVQDGGHRRADVDGAEPELSDRKRLLVLR